MLERLASVGLGGKKEEDDAPSASQNEPRIIEQAQAAAAEAPAELPEDTAPAAETPDNVHQLPQQIDPGLEDDDLEIPAFLRRQAN